MNRKGSYGAVIVIVVLACVVAALSAQTAVSGRPPATLEDLIAEIRGLRADLAQSASATIRSQLLVARLQVQEQRINGITRQITETQNELAGMRQGAGAVEARFKEMKENFATASAEEREAMEQMQRDMGPQLALFQQRMQELSRREADLIHQFSLEQARWSEFNDRLDALERSLPTDLR